MLVSPVNTNVGWELDALLEELLLDELLNRNSENGTGTNLPSAEEVLEPEEVEPGLELPPKELELELDPPVALAPGLELPPVELELPLLALELRDITQKSILPEAGLTMPSSMVPSVWPEVLCTCAPVSLLNRTSWCPMWL